MSSRKICTILGLAACSIFMGSKIAAADIVSTIEDAKSGSTVSLSGTYSAGVRITVPSGVTLQGPATINFTQGSGADGLYVPAGNSSVKMNSITVTGANHGFMIYGGSTTLTSCIAHNNANTGLEFIGSSAKSDTMSSCQSYDNADSSGGNADGGGVKQGTGSGNKVTNCTFHNNSDDGLDLEKSSSPVTVSGCQSYSEGSYNGKQGNGDGFKMGISGDNVAHVMTSDVAHDNTAGNTASGFDTNDNAATIKLTTCHSYNNKNKDRLQHVTLTNCTMET